MYLALSFSSKSASAVVATFRSFSVCNVLVGGSISERHRFIALCRVYEQKAESRIEKNAV